MVNVPMTGMNRASRTAPIRKRTPTIPPFKRREKSLSVAIVIPTRRKIRLFARNPMYSQNRVSSSRRSGPIQSDAARAVINPHATTAITPENPSSSPARYVRYAATRVAV